jgi:hypothetical protein
MNSVPRIGRRSFSPIAKFRGEGFRFFGGDLPHGAGSVSGSSFGDFPKNWKGLYGRSIGGASPAGSDVTKEEIRDKRIEPEVSPAARCRRYKNVFFVRRKNGAAK